MDVPTEHTDRFERHLPCETVRRWFCPWALGLCSLGFAVAQPALQSTSTQQLLEQGQALAQQGRLAEAEVALDKAVDLAPNDPTLLTLLGKVKGRLGENDAALAIFQRVIALTPKDPDAHLNLAIALSDAGKLPDALDETAKALAIAPNMAGAHRNRARILDDLKREPEAAAEFAVACRLEPNEPSGYFYWSFVERAEGHFAKETALLQRVVALQPSNDKAFLLLANSLLEQSRKNEAIAALRRALAIQPNSSEATYMLSRALLASDPAESKRLRERYAELRAQGANLERSKALGNQAYEATVAQKWQQAIELYKEALEVCGDCAARAALHKNLGLTLCRSGNLKEGHKELEEALALDPNDRDVVQALSLLGHP